MKIVIATIKSWNIRNAQHFKKLYHKKIEVIIITDRSKLTYENLKSINPEYIFFPHWSWLIPKKIYEAFTCIVFHMTDLPFGRGGSPLQNLIVRGIENTKISAIKVEEGMDTGDIYLKRDLNLSGSAEEIFIRASKIIIHEMIPNILENEIIPQKQQGEVIEFKRRTPEESEIDKKLELEQIYDHIRMLDGEGYPNAFIKFGPYKILFSRASLKDGKIIADAQIVEEEI